MDILIAILLGLGLVMGIKSGAVRQLLSLVSFAAALTVAYLYSGSLAAAFIPHVGSPVGCKVVAFVLLMAIVLIAAKFAGNLITSLLDLLVLPGLLNRIAGGVFGLFKAALVLGTCLWIASTAHILTEEQMQQSRLCGPLKAVPEYFYRLIK